MIDPKDIETILQQPEGEDLYEMATQTKKAFCHAAELPAIDVEQEWKKFSARHSNHTWRTHPWAVAASLLLVFGVAVAAVLPPVLDRLAQRPADREEVVSTTTDEVTTGFVFHDVALSEILQTLATHYGATIDCQNTEAMKMRLYIQMDKSLSLEDAVAFLNHFDQVNLQLDGQVIIVNKTTGR